VSAPIPGPDVAADATTETPPTPRTPRESDDGMAKLRDAARQMGVDKLRDGTWFRRAVAAHVKKHHATVGPDHWEKLYPGLTAEQRAEKEIARVAQRAAATGACASLGASAGELVSFFTEGLAAPIGVPAAMLSMALEAGYTALLQIDLVCDLASIYGVPFDANDVGEVATLFGLALEVEVKETRKSDGVEEQDAPKGLTAKLIELEDGDVATRIGRKMLEESVVKNIVPVVGMAISARWNYVATRKLAATARKYIRYRHALRHALGKLKLTTVSAPELLVEGAWLLATVDGEAGHEEVMAIALILEALPQDRRPKIELGKTLDDDEEKWFDGLSRASPDMHDALLDVLYLVAATDKALEASERRFLRRVGKALGRDVDFDRVEQICRHLARGDELPDGFYHCVS
jgi:uncharacterized protein (DUF697 family)